MAKQRLVQLDILKGIGIILVLFGHSLHHNSISREIIYLFHMPLFFFCSGIFHRQSPLLYTVRDSIKRLLLPYLFFLFVYQLIYFSYSFVISGSIDTYLTYFSSESNLLNRDSLFYYTIWFLICLFWIKILYAILYKLSNGNKNIIFLLVLCGLIVSQYARIPFFIDTALTSLVYYHMGYVFKHSTIREITPPIYFHMLIFGVACIIGLFLHNDVDLKNNSHPIYHPIIACVLIYALYGISNYIVSNTCHLLIRILSKCGVASLTIFGLHRSCWLYMYVIFARLGLSQTMESIMLVLLSIPLLLFADMLITRCIPFVYGRLRK